MPRVSADARGAGLLPDTRSHATVRRACPETRGSGRIPATVGFLDVAPRGTISSLRAAGLMAPLEHAGLHPPVSLAKRGELLEGVFVGCAAFIPTPTRG